MKIKYLLILILVLAISCTTQHTAKQSPKSEAVKVAVFKGNGGGEVSVIETLEALKIDTGIRASALTAVEIMQGKLRDYDVLIIPGGSGSKQLNNLGKKGAALLRHFVVEEGKGMVGICAGAYFLSSTEGYPNLHLASSIQLDRLHYNRGRGLVELELSEPGKAFFPELKGHRLFLQYYDGPVLAPKDSVMEYEEMGRFVSDIHPDNFGPAGLTPGKTFLLRQKVGKGRVFLSAGHPESTPGMRWMVARMARWAAGAPTISYHPNWVRPEINGHEIIFDKALRKKEKNLFWQLFSDTAQIQIAAMDSLYALRSRPAVRWNMGLLRDNKPATRQHAAMLLMQTEYTAALPDLRQALKQEDNPEAEKTISKAIDYLTTH